MKQGQAIACRTRTHDGLESVGKIFIIGFVANAISRGQALFGPSIRSTDISWRG